MKIEELKEIKTIIKDEKIYELLSLILNAGFLIPNTYMFISILMNEMKKDNKIPVFAIPYLTMIIYSSLKIDLELDKKRLVNKI